MRIYLKGICYTDKGLATVFAVASVWADNYGKAIQEANYRIAQLWAGSLPCIIWQDADKKLVDCLTREGLNGVKILAKQVENK